MLYPEQTAFVLNDFHGVQNPRLMDEDYFGTVLEKYNELAGHQTAAEADISNFDKWIAIKRPVLPVRIDRGMVDVIAMTDDGFQALKDCKEIRLGELIKEPDCRDRDEEGW